MDKPDETRGRPMRVYADTSAFGGALGRCPRYSCPVPPLKGESVQGASARDVFRHWHSLLDARVRRQLLRDFFADLAPLILRVEIGEDADALQQAYMKAQIVGPKWETDAMHVAVATVSGCRAIVSWNFKHIVNFRRIPLYNGVNQTEGYGSIAIHTPPEVIFDEED